MGRNEIRRPLLEPSEVRATLVTILDAVAWSGAARRPEFRLVGTAAALAQGVRLATSDVDILLGSRDDVDTFAAALAGFPCSDSPTWLADARQYFARFDVDGTDVEFSTVEQTVHTDTWECAGPGPWRHHVLLDIGEHAVPVVSLELRLVSELVRKREDRYLPLIEYLREHGADFSLVARAMRERDVDSVLRRHVTEQLGPHHPDPAR